MNFEVCKIYFWSLGKYLVRNIIMCSLQCGLMISLLEKLKMQYQLSHYFYFLFFMRVDHK